MATEELIKELETLQYSLILNEEYILAKNTKELIKYLKRQK